MKQLLLLATLVVINSLACLSQKLAVDTMYCKERDLAASMERVEDATGRACALVKVRLPRGGASFEGNVIEPVKMAQSEYLVYMYPDSKNLTVKLAGTVAVNVDFRRWGIERLESMRTYILEIQVPDNAGHNVDDGMQYFTLKVTPPNAIVNIDYQYKMLKNDGTLVLRLARGEHVYKIEAEGYVTKEGSFTLGDERKDLVERLTSSMAQLTVRCATPDASIYVNEVMKGTGSWSGALVPGNYLVEARLDGHTTQSKSVRLVSNQTLGIDLPALDAFSGQLDVNYSPIDAEVWIDGVRKGTSPNRFAHITVGSHRVEIRKEGYETLATTVSIRDGEITPLSGSLSEKKTVAKTSTDVVAIASDVQSDKVEVTRWDSLYWVYGDSIWKDKELLSQLAKKGDAMAQYIIADTIYHNARLWGGEGRDDLYKEANNLFKKSAKKGNAFSQNRLGESYLWGRGVKKDYAEALKWFRLSAEQGLKDGQFNLGEMYEYGEGIPQDYEQAQYWYQKAAEQGKYGAKEALFNLQALIECASSATNSPVAPATPPTKQTFTVNGVEFTMVRVEGGTFTMGATAEQGRDAFDDEKPVHQVTLSTYLIGETEVTLGLWIAVMGNAGWQLIRDSDRTAVHNVSLGRFKYFIKKLNEMTGKIFRLPTEAEWEYAARGGNQSKGYKYAGSNWIGDVAWYRKNSFDIGFRNRDNYGPHEVATKQPNELGLYDMSGNVAEMCSDWYADDYYATSSQFNPQGPEKRKWPYVLRGGSWEDWGHRCRSSARSKSLGENAAAYIGFRLVLSE